MPRRRVSEAEDDEDYDPYDSFDDTRRVRQRGDGSNPLRSSRGRPVKARQYMNEDESDTEDDEYGTRRATQDYNQRGGNGSYLQGYEDEYHRPQTHQKPKQTKRQRWVPHNPLILGGFDDDEDSKDPQISDDDDTGDEGASRARRRSTENRMKGSSVPVRDESGKFIGVRPQTPAERRQAQGAFTLQATATGVKGPVGGGIFKTAAVTVLREERRLMSTGEIARIALKRGYIKVQGRTPEATMASAMYTDVKRKEDRSTFIRPHEGLFGLREWLEEGVNFKDPIEDKYPDESTQAVLRRNRINATQQMARANSRGSGAGQRGRSSPAYDPFLPASSQSLGNSTRGEPLFDKDDFPPDLPEIGSRHNDDISIGLPPRIAAGLQGLEGKGTKGFQPTATASTPFGSNRGGPSPEIFKSRFADGATRGGFLPSGRRSSSGPQPPGFQRTNSGGRKQRKPGPNMSQQDSGNMLLLLNAVEGVKSMDRSSGEGRRQGFVPRTSGLAGRRHVNAPTSRREGGEGERPLQLTIQGFNAGRMAAAQAPGSSQAGHQQKDQVNILNLPLLEGSVEQGTMDGPEVPPPGVEIDPSGGGVSLQPPGRLLNSTPPPGAEAALQALDSAFARAPLPIAGSLSGPLAPAIRMPSEMLLPMSTCMSDILSPDMPPTLAPATTAVSQNDTAAMPAGTFSAQPPMGAAVPPLPGSGPSASTSMATPLPSLGSHSLQMQTGNMPQMSMTGTLPNDFGTPEAGAKRLPEVEAAVRAMESSMGDRHPKVGKAYLYLSRVYQCVATPEYYQKAQQALHHAYEICFACQKPQQ